jgi:hypothetical protein
MGKTSSVKDKPQGARWPFDPLQPGDHEPVRLPEELERVQKQTGAGRKPRPTSPTKRSKP